MRVGIGYDVHRFVVGRKLILGGIEIPFQKGLEGWSDGDVAIHAIIDALLGAAALGDIGTHFPSSDPQYENISSLTLLRRTIDLIDHNGWIISNVDVTIVLQEPRLSTFTKEMSLQIAAALAIDVDQINIKAKTTDGLGFTGDGTGVAAYAVAMMRASNENI